MKMFTMRKIGIIGGAGPLASSLLLESIIHECYRHGCENETAFPEIILVNKPFNISLCTQIKNGRLMIYDALQTCIDQLLNNGVKTFVVACNTFHLFLDGVTTGDGHFVKINQATLQAAQRQNLKRLLILGTPLTLHHQLYQHQTIECLTPPEEYHVGIEKIINKILAGNVLAEDSARLSTMINKLHGALDFDGVVLGCTELPVLHRKHPLQINNLNKTIVLDTIQLLAESVVDHI